MMTTWRLLTTTWFLEPSILCGCAALLVAYAYLAQPRTAGRSALYASGVLVLLLSLISPIDTLGDGYLFSAHMLQHLLLVLIAPPLLLLGIPPTTWTALLAWSPARRAEAALGQPLAAWLLGLGTLWVWHAPSLYDAAVRDQGIHIVQHLSFLVTATVFWWPILAPGADQEKSAGRNVSQDERAGRSESEGDDRRRLSPLGSIAYLMAAVVASSVLGIIITFAPTGLYPVYLHPIDRLGVLPLLRQGWGLSPAADQRIGGVLMWTVSSPVYLLGVVAVLARWYTAPEEEQPSPPPHAFGGGGAAAPTPQPALPAALYGLDPDRLRPVPVQPTAGEGRTTLASLDYS